MKDNFVPVKPVSDDSLMFSPTPDIEDLSDEQRSGMINYENTMDRPVKRSGSIG